MGLKEYVPASVIFVLTAVESYMLYGFMISNANVPEGPVFTLETLAPVIGAVILALTAFVGAIPTVKASLGEKFSSSKIYWAGISLVVLISLVLLGAGLLSGSVEYTQFQAAAS